ncbi:unnamed protein product [Rhodiola kirilowii]
MLNARKLEEGPNKTLITLIPKVKDPKAISEYRPISLCNVGAKIVTKVLANRLKPILPAIISDNQGAFVSGKIISDNIVAAQELIHYINTRGRQRNGYFALKLDISKAYDRVEWDFLEEMMQRLGFPENWISMVMACRGKKLKGVKICRGAPEVTHMLFADDIIFFLRATLENAVNLKKILEEYGALSGQKVNHAKSEIFFGKNVGESDKQRISAALGVRQVE